MLFWAETRSGTIQENTHYRGRETLTLSHRHAASGSVRPPRKAPPDTNQEGSWEIWQWIVGFRPWDAGCEAPSSRPWLLVLGDPHPGMSVGKGPLVVVIHRCWIGRLGAIIVIHVTSAQKKRGLCQKDTGPAFSEPEHACNTTATKPLQIGPARPFAEGDARHKPNTSRHTLGASERLKCATSVLQECAETDSGDSDLAELTELWPRLSAEVRAEILRLARQG
jgi:hypothetical protein